MRLFAGKEGRRKMAIRKEKIEKQYSRIPMEYLHNKDLTLKEKGMLAVLYSLPESWLFSIEGLARSEADGICLLRSTISTRESTIIRLWKSSCLRHKFLKWMFPGMLRQNESRRTGFR